MVQLPNVDKVGITDLFLELSGHLHGPPKDDFMAKQAPNSSKIALLDSEIVIRWPILTGFGPEYENGLFWTKSIQIGDYFSGQNARFGTIWGLKMACFPF